MKQIYLEVLLNGNDAGCAINLPDNDADALTALFNEAKETILKGTDEEDWYTIFDPWFKDKAPELYAKVLKHWCNAYTEGMNENTSPESLASLNKHMSVERTIDGFILSDDNEICIAGVS